MNKPFETRFFVDSDKDSPTIFDLLKIIQKAMQNASIDHAEVIGYGNDEMSRYHVFWAIARLRVKVLLPLQNRHHYRMITWPNPYDIAGIDRNYQVYDQLNQLVIQGIGKWVIVDKENFSLIKPSQFELTKHSKPTPDEKVISGGYIRIHQTDTNHGSYQYIRQVKTDEIDQNGHVNNVEYLGYIAETLLQYSNNQFQIHEYQINYSQSLFEGDIISLNVSIINQDIQIQAKRTRDNQTIFSAIVLYKRC